MPGNQDSSDQDQRTGGYGGSTGGQDPAQDPGSQEDHASAAGRDNPGADAVDADEAMGNRSGGYGSPAKDADRGEAGGGS